jgi:hypothetical protein
MGAGNELQLDSSHCRAICDEIGERLRMVLDHEAAPLPPRLQLLMERLIEQDLVDAPSIAPGIDDMVWELEPIESEPGSILAA